MIIVKLGGGLGNQMFQYALGRRLARDGGDELALDASVFENDTKHIDYRAFGLPHFNIQARIATPEEVERLRYPHGKLARKVWNRIERHILRRQHIRFEPGVLKKTRDAYLEGYWQSPKYFDSVRPAIVADLSLAKPYSAGGLALAQEIGQARNSVSLHVRRGDYSRNAEGLRIYGTYCDQSYYDRALSEVLKRLPGPLSVFVFSDDIEWVKANLKLPAGARFVAHGEAPDYERLMLMSLCKAHVICNSTFGWWGAWLDDKQGKVVVAPKVWIPGIDLPVDDIVPADWIRA
jgi:hypothetical protein